MSYQIIILPKAVKDLKKLPKNIFLNIDETILNLAINPRPIGCKKLKGFADTYRIRVGDYRIVYRLQDKQLIIEVIRVIDRQEGYNMI